VAGGVKYQQHLSVVPYTKEMADNAEGLFYENPGYLVAQHTADMFGGITQRRLVLKSSDKAWTDGFTLNVPFDDPHSYRILEHQLAHVLFKTDPHARKFFVELYTRQMKEHDPSLPLEGLERALTGLINILDNYRVNSLWGYLYEGSYVEIMRKDAMDAKQLIADPHQNLMCYIHFMACNGKPPYGKCDRFEPLVVEALQRVSGCGYETVLATARWLLVQCVSELLRAAKDLPMLERPVVAPPDHGKQPTWEPPQPSNVMADRSAVLRQIPSLFGQLPPQLEEALNDMHVSAMGSGRAEEESRQVVQRAREGLTNVDEVLELSRAEMLDVIKGAKSAIASNPEDDSQLHQDVPAQVVFHDLTPDKLEGVERTPMSEDDEAVVRRLQAVFTRVMTQRKMTFDDSGTEIDVGRMLERRMTHEPIPCFKREEKGQGFHALILIDKSISMEEVNGQRPRTQGLHPESSLAQAHRACRIISRALSGFPFVTLDVWGFTALDDGTLDIARYDPKLEVYDAPDVNFSGITPLHLAIRLAASHLSKGHASKQLFALTDGLPSFARRDGLPVNFRTLMKLTAIEVNRARKNNVNVTGVMLGAQSEVSDEDLFRMFGAQRHWSRLNTGAFGNELVELVTSSFSTYLRRK
jgi:hypothetical protein